jgi:RNA-directed DNA polymerase
LGNLATPKSVQKLQTALHAKAKAEAGYRFYALYDKISREDILAHAYAQCRSNKGAPGIDGQVFADIEAYGVERWLAELALALREETYRPEPIRRVFIPKANGKLRPLGISSVRDRVCMTAATLVLEPIFWEHSPYRAHEIGSAPARRPACAASDQDVAGVRRRGNRRPRTEATHDRSTR